MNEYGLKGEGFGARAVLTLVASFNLSEVDIGLVQDGLEKLLGRRREVGMSADDEMLFELKKQMEEAVTLKR